MLLILVILACITLFYQSLCKRQKDNKRSVPWQILLTTVVPPKDLCALIHEYVGYQPYTPGISHSQVILINTGTKMSLDQRMNMDHTILILPVYPAIAAQFREIKCPSFFALG